MDLSIVSIRMLIEHMDRPQPADVHQPRVRVVASLVSRGLLRGSGHRFRPHSYHITEKGREMLSQILGRWADILTEYELKRIDVERTPHEQVQVPAEVAETMLARAFREDCAIKAKHDREAGKSVPAERKRFRSSRSSTYRDYSVDLGGDETLGADQMERDGVAEQRAAE